MTEEQKKTTEKTSEGSKGKKIAIISAVAVI